MFKNKIMFSCSDINKQEDYVKKTFKLKRRYLTERNIYQNYGFLSFVPPLIEFNDSEKSITIKNCGQSLDIKYDEQERWKFREKIIEMSKKLNEFGLHHNDIRWKNVLESSDGQLFLIDFEYTSFHNIETNYDKIL